MLQRPLKTPPEKDFIICGCPRSGTSLVAGLLYQPPRVVVAMEPWDGMRLPPAELFTSLRREITETRRLTRQRLNVEVLANEGRIEWCPEGTVTPPLEVREDFILGLKWPAFWRYLDDLSSTKFILCIRDPVEVVASFRNSGGRLAHGLNYDIAFNHKMNSTLIGATADEAERRVLLYDYINSRLIPHLDRPNVFVLRYERWFIDKEQLVSELGSFLGTELNPARIRITRRRPAVHEHPDALMVRKLCSTAVDLGYG